MMNSVQDTGAPPLPAPQTSRRHRTASSEHDSPNDPASSDSDRRRQKRRRVEADSDVLDPAHPSPSIPSSAADFDASQPSTSTLTYISTWEIPLDVVPIGDDVGAHPTDADSPPASQSPNRVLTDQSAAAATPPHLAALIELSDSDDPIIEPTQTDRTTPGGPIIVHDRPASPPSPNAIETAAPSASTQEPLSAYTCPICFSPPTNATLTPCGHICCGQCLFTAVKTTIRRSMAIAMERAPVARCPVCRAEIPGWDGHGGGVIGLKVHFMYSL